MRNKTYEFLKKQEKIQRHKLAYNLIKGNYSKGIRMESIKPFTCPILHLTIILIPNEKTVTITILGQYHIVRLETP